ncbi:MAG: hypothetical protein H6629_21475 [Calditrichae bacterium]|nr:hypothetical protein [Calditrichia bacterium]
MENDKTTWFSTRDALYSDRIYSVLEDNSGRLWFSSNKGIFCVEKQQLNRIAATGQREPLNCRVFNHLDGMRQAECNGRRQPVAWKAPDGRFWYVTVIGAVSIHPDSFTPIRCRRRFMWNDLSQMVIRDDLFCPEKMKCNYLLTTAIWKLNTQHSAFQCRSECL